VPKTGNFLPAFSDAKIRQAMKAAGGHVKTAAAALGVDFSSFYARLKTMRDNGSPVITAAAAALAKKQAAAKKKTPAKKAAAPAKKAPAKKKAAAAAKKAAVKKKTAAKKKR
jgi:hypothetical protein